MASKEKKPKSNARAPKTPNKKGAPEKIMAIDVGGTKVKFLLLGETEPRKLASGKKLVPAKMVQGILERTADWDFDAVSIGYPGLVGDHGPKSEPGNLGPGWVGFDFAAAFGRPVRIINDAAMQALGSYDGGRMLFLGFGTGLGSALIAEKVIVPMELGALSYKDGRPIGEVVGKASFDKLGKAAWRQIVVDVVAMLMHALVVDHVVLGGGNAKYLRDLPPGTRLGHNLTAFRGGFRLWNIEDVQTLTADHAHSPPPEPTDWRLI